MHMDYTGRSAKIGPGRVWVPMMRLAGLFLAGAVLLAMMLVGLFLVLPVMLIGGIALYLYLRRQLNRARRRPPADGVIDAECFIVEHR
jgi:hypothetical protein